MDSPSLALLTDLYQLTMAYGYWKQGVAEKQACFNLYFRSNPFGGGYTIAAGLAPALDYIRGFRFHSTDLEYLASLTGSDGKPLFEEAFLQYLGALRLTVDIDAVSEGTVVFPHEPLLRVKGPILQCQLLETALLNIINFQSLIATKASRVKAAAKGDPVLEFGLRRAQGIDGGLSASRAAYIGGCDATSNVLAGKMFGIPVRGTHAHSWVMLFEDEVKAFQAYAECLPSNCVFLVDTYKTLEGVKHAIEVGKELRKTGHDLLGIRIDSGDLAFLSIEARKMLDAEGFQKTVIFASNDLDEHLIESLKAQGAKVGSWGVGTKLVTAYDQPALGGVYKLVAVEEDGKWIPRIKVSEQTAKTTTPGVLNVRRYLDAEGNSVADMIYDEHSDSGYDGDTIIDPVDPMHRKTVALDGKGFYTDLLIPAVRDGKVTYNVPSLQTTRANAANNLRSLHPSVRRFANPHRYPAGLEEGLYNSKTALALKAKGVEE